jgi:hypothetical protein
MFREASKMMERLCFVISITNFIGLILEMMMMVMINCVLWDRQLVTHFFIITNWGKKTGLQISS